jgi:phytoene synthase
MIAKSELSRETLEAYATCGQIIRRAAKTFYWGSLLLPRRKRLAAWALYAFCRSVDDGVDGAADPEAAAAQLDLWRDRLLRAYDGVASDPITHAWIDMCRHFDVPLQPALDLIEGARMDLHPIQPATFDELHLYCYRVAGTVGLLMAPVLGYRSPEALPLAVDLGVAMQLTNILRDVGEDLRNGRIYLPRDEMARFGYSEADLRAGVVDGRFVELMHFQMRRAEAYFARARPGIAMLERSAQLSILASAEMYRGILGAICANGYDVFTQRAFVPFATKLRMVPRLWLSLKTAPSPTPHPISDGEGEPTEGYLSASPLV